MHSATSRANNRSRTALWDCFTRRDCLPGVGVVCGDGVVEGVTITIFPFISVLDGMWVSNPLSWRALLKWLQSMKESPLMTVDPDKRYFLQFKTSSVFSIYLTIQNTQSVCVTSKIEHKQVTWEIRWYDKFVLWKREYINFF